MVILKIIKLHSFEKRLRKKPKKDKICWMTFYLGKKRNPPCFLNAIHPTQLLQPIKTEWISVNPPVYQFHGVFTHQECDEFWATGQ